MLLTSVAKKSILYVAGALGSAFWYVFLSEFSQTLLLILSEWIKISWNKLVLLFSDDFKEIKS